MVGTKLKRWIFLLLITSLNNWSFGSAAEQPISLHYNERPPYLITVAPGIVAGLTATPAEQAFQSAAIPHVWIKTPSKRQMAFLQQNQGRDCLVGWFKNPQRERFAKYTQAIYQDKPIIAIALSSNNKVGNGRSVEAFFKDRTLRLLLKDGYSYGKFLDGLINDLDPVRQVVTIENISMLEMLNQGRADYLFVAKEEADSIIERMNITGEKYQYIYISDMPAENNRYIMCSMQVEDSIIERLNYWIAKHRDNKK